MKWTKPFDLFLFDLDGLLVDTESLHYKAYQQLCHLYDVELPWDFKQYLGVAHSGASALEEAISPLLPERSWDHYYQQKKKLYLECLHSKDLKLMPGVEALIKHLAQEGVKRCVVTHSSKEQVSTIKQLIPLLKTIPVWITREDYEAPKPAPDGYLEALSLLRDPQDKVIGFEDSLRGFQSLQQTDAHPVLICDPDHPQMLRDELKGVTHFPSFSQIKSII